MHCRSTCSIGCPKPRSTPSESAATSSASRTVIWSGAIRSARRPDTTPAPLTLLGRTRLEATRCGRQLIRPPCAAHHPRAEALDAFELAPGARENIARCIRRDLLLEAVRQSEDLRVLAASRRLRAFLIMARFFALRGIALPCVQRPRVSTPARAALAALGSH